MDDKVFPIQQGKLDFLCGIYAAINAIAVRDEIRELDQAAIPFRLGISYMQTLGWSLADAICFGVDEEEYGTLLKKMSFRDWIHYPNPDVKCVNKILLDLKNDKVLSLIVSLVDRDAAEFGVSRNDNGDRYVEHYTVVTGTTDEGLLIDDSQGFKLIEREGKSFDKLSYGGDPVKIGYLYVMEWDKKE